MPLPYRGSRLGARLGALRVGLGAVMVSRPLLVPRPLGFDSITATRVEWLVQMAGARDLALGAGTLAARRSGAQRLWLIASLGSDVADALVLSKAVRRGHIGRLMGSAVALSAVVAAALGVVALATQEEPDHE